jgi:hypothetical protein
MPHRGKSEQRVKRRQKRITEASEAAFCLFFHSASLPTKSPSPAITGEGL